MNDELKVKPVSAAVARKIMETRIDPILKQLDDVMQKLVEEGYPIAVIGNVCCIGGGSLTNNSFSVGYGHAIQFAHCGLLQHMFNEDNYESFINLTESRLHDDFLEDIEEEEEEDHNA